MSDSSLRPTRWAFWGTGRIAHLVAQDLPLAGASLYAVGSRTLSKAQEFAAMYKAPCAYEGLGSLLADPQVDVVYIAGPNHVHAADALAVIEAGKAVLIEKPFALNAVEAETVIAAARAKGVFCMEAMWTRFIPSVTEIRRIVRSGVLGDVRSMLGSFGFAAPPNLGDRSLPHTQGGGALLDLGVYLVSMAQYLLGAPERVAAFPTLVDGCDRQVAFQMEWRSGASASFAASFNANLPNDFFIAGDRGTLHIDAPFYHPHRFTLTQTGAPAARVPGPPPSGLRHSSAVKRLRRSLSPLVSVIRGGKSTTLSFPGNGYQFQLQEVMRCLQTGLQESPIMSLKDSLSVMQMLDALRAKY